MIIGIVTDLTVTILIAGTHIAPSIIISGKHTVK